MCHPGLDPAVMCAATTGPRLQATPTLVVSQPSTVDVLVVSAVQADVTAAKQLYVERGLKLGKSFGSKYVEFEPAPRRIVGA